MADSLILQYDATEPSETYDCSRCGCQYITLRGDCHEVIVSGGTITAMHCPDCLRREGRYPATEIMH